MKLFTSLALAACLLSTQAFAQEVKPSDSSLQELLQVTHADDLAKSLAEQMDSIFQSTAQQVTRGRAATPEQQKAIDNFQGKMNAILHRQISWEELQPQLMQIYRDTLSQEEVDSMIAFYKTAVGQSITKKMPLIFQASTYMVQKKIPAMTAEIDQAAKESFKDLKPSK